MKRQFKVYSYIAFVFSLLISITSHSQNLLNNGGFESGGSGNGFLVNTTGYSPASVTGTSVPGNFAFVTNPQSLNSTFNAGGDHTSGSGSMMVVDGSTTPGLNFFWTGGPTGGAINGFVVGKRYKFSYWIKSISSDVTNLATQANINFFTAPGDIDPTSIVPSSLSFIAPLPASGWQQVSYEFTATDTAILFRLYNTNTSALGNDFAIDDMSVVCASPPNLVITNPATACNPNTVNITVPAVTTGSDSGALTYYSNSGATSVISNPSAIATSGTYYIKNTASLGCETIKPVVVTIAPTVAPPIPITPINICIAALTALIATPSVGHTLLWYGTAATGGTSSTVATIPAATGTYFVSQTNGTCESGRVVIQANLVADTGAKFLSLRCDSSFLTVAEQSSAVYFDWANDPLSVNDIYNYSCTIQGGTPISGTTSNSSLKVSGLLPGQSVTMTLTSSKYPCKPTAIQTCKVPCSSPLLKPNFPLITQTYCVGNTMPVLSNTSPNGVVGTWSPAIISNAASGNYTFTPDPISFPCAEPQILSVTVNPISSPTFPAFPVSVCQNSTGQVLPTDSNNTIPIRGTWSPFPSINTSILGQTKYTFIPIFGQCVSVTPVQITITVNSNAAPTFTPITPFCAGTTSPLLPTSSIEGIAGNWSPSVISNTLSGNYQFTPDISLHPCAPIPPPLTITVNQNLTPTFAVSDTQCEGIGFLTLPNSSTNTSPILGTWNPTTVDTSTLGSNTYVFTPNLGSCVVSATFPKTIEVVSNATPTFDPILPFCSGTPIPILQPASNEGILGTWNPSSISGSVGTKKYQFTPSSTCSPTPAPLSVTILQSATPSFSPIVPNDVCEGVSFSLPDTSNDTPPITGSWETLTGLVVTSVDTTVPRTETYTFIPDSGQCAIAPDPFDITVHPSNTLIKVDYSVTDAFEDNQIITVVATAAGNYLYQLDSGPIQTSNVFENVSAGKHTITVSDANGCSTSITEANVLVIKHPKYFTPNGDGFNDTWKITGLSSSLINKIYIFDRYGKLLKEIATDGTGWDGTYLGVPVPADDYWFTVDYAEDSLPKKFKAHFTLKR